MSFENRLNRRDFLKISGATTAAPLLVASFNLASQVSNAFYLHSKQHTHPQLKEVDERHPIKLGVYPQDNSLENIAYPEDFQIVGYFPQWHDWHVEEMATLPDNQVPMLSLAPSHHGEPNRPFRYSDLQDQRDHTKKQASQLRDLPACLVRYGYEMNGDWFPYGSGAQSPKEFVAGWQLVTEVIKDINPRIQTAWSPNVDYPIKPYFPDHSEPDYVGLDGYNKHHTSPTHARHLNPNPSFAQLFDNDISTLQEMNKPILITEVGVDFGSSNRARKASLDWMTDALNTAPTYRNVEGFCIFAWNKGKSRLDFAEANWGNVLNDQLHDAVKSTNLYFNSNKIL